LHLVFLAGKKNKNQEAVTIAYCLFPIPYPRQKTFMPNGTLREQQALLICLALHNCGMILFSLFTIKLNSS